MRAKPYVWSENTFWTDYGSMLKIYKMRTSSWISWKLCLKISIIIGPIYTKSFDNIRWKVSL